MYCVKIFSLFQMLIVYVDFHFLELLESLLHLLIGLSLMDGQGFLKNFLMILDEI